MLLAVAVLGTTEYGTIDPVDRVVDARDRHAAQGLGFGVHVDGAWGGYLATLFRNSDGSLRTLAEVRNGFDAFPSTEVHAAFGALGRTDSITVDPHKLGYLPYGAGAFIGRDHRAMALLAARARRFAESVSGILHAVVPFAPDSSLDCLALNPVGNSDVSRANAFVRLLHDELRCDPSQPLQLKEFLSTRPEGVALDWGSGLRVQGFAGCP